MIWLLSIPFLIIIGRFLIYKNVQLNVKGYNKHISIEGATELQSPNIFSYIKLILFYLVPAIILKFWSLNNPGIAVDYDFYIGACIIGNITIIGWQVADILKNYYAIKYPEALSGKVVVSKSCSIMFTNFLLLPPLSMLVVFGIANPSRFICGGIFFIAVMIIALAIQLNSKSIDQSAQP